MTAKEYKIIIGALLVVNMTCLIIISVLCGEINLLQDRLSEMCDTVRALDEKISNIEVTQENFHNKSLQNEKVVEKGNKYILGGILVIIGVVIVTHLGGIDPGNLGKVFNLSADQLTVDLINQNDLISKNLELFV